MPDPEGRPGEERDDLADRARRSTPRPCRRNGLRRKTPHRPMTTLGIAASSSTRKPTGTATRRGASSARKIAVSRPIGAAKIRARRGRHERPDDERQRAVDRRHRVPLRPGHERQAELAPGRDAEQEQQDPDAEEQDDDRRTRTRPSRPGTADRADASPPPSSAGRNVQGCHEGASSRRRTMSDDPTAAGAVAASGLRIAEIGIRARSALPPR